MRVSIWAMLAVAVGLMTAPARAQTYDPRFPFCLDAHDGNGSYMDCSYYTREQCAASDEGAEPAGRGGALRQARGRIPAATGGVSRTAKPNLVECGAADALRFALRRAAAGEIPNG